MKYNFKKIQAKWQKEWAKNKYRYNEDETKKGE